VALNYPNTIRHQMFRIRQQMVLMMVSNYERDLEFCTTSFPNCTSNSTRKLRVVGGTCENTSEEKQISPRES